MTSKISDNKNITDLRNLIRKENSMDRTLYNILGAIRGPDMYSKQGDYKVFTKAIRSYIGFTRPNNCSGDDMKAMFITESGFNNLWKKLKDAEKSSSDEDGHYLGHLVYAIESIGFKNLVWFLKKRKAFRPELPKEAYEILK